MTVPALPYDDGVLFEIAHVDCGTLVDDVRVLANQEPTHMREEEAPLRVMRIGVRVCEFMVNSVIPYPFVNVILRNLIR